MSIADIAARKAAIDREEIRRLVLEALVGDPDYAISHYVLRRLVSEYGHAESDVARELTWLEERGLISTNVIAGSMPESVITRLGADVANGRKAFPGVPSKGLGQ